MSKQDYDWGIADNAEVPHAWLSYKGDVIVTAPLERAENLERAATSLNITENLAGAIA